MPQPQSFPAMVASCLALLFAASPLSAKESCFASLMNRTAEMDSTGYFRLDNVPAGVAKSRVRIVCTDSGRVRLGSSEVFEIPANEGYGVGPIVWDSAPPIPRSIDFSLPDTVRSTEPLTLVVRGQYADGSTRLVSDSTLSWIVSNPRLGTVSSEGVFQPRTSGRVLLTASVEGAVRIRSVVVLLGADQDNDGLPDDWEVANGLDPRQPLDALEDLDGDGLTALDEFRLGTLVRTADSDGDNLKDGQEGPLGTNPLLADTDGDLVPDGLEVELGTDPRVAGSDDLASATVELKVEPFRLDFLLPVVVPRPQSLPVIVKVVLKDGREVVVTSAIGAVTMNPLIAIIPESGIVEAISFGTTLVKYSLGGKSVELPVTVREDLPVPLAVVPFKGFPFALKANEGFVFLATGANGLKVVDVSDPNTPIMNMDQAVVKSAFGLELRNDSLWVAAGVDGVYLIDVSDPSRMRVLKHWGGVGESRNLSLSLDRLVVSSMTSRIDVLVPSTLEWLSSATIPGQHPNGMSYSPSGKYLAVALGSAGVSILKSVEPGFSVLTTLRTAGASGVHWASETDLLISNGFGPELGGLVWIDLESPLVPFIRGQSEKAVSLQDVAGEAGVFVGADLYAWNSVPVYRMGELGPIEVGSVDYFRFPGAFDDNLFSVDVVGNIAFTAGVGELTRPPYDDNPWLTGRLYVSKLWTISRMDNATPAPPIISSRTVDDVIFSNRSIQFKVGPKSRVGVRSVRVRCVECKDSEWREIVSPWLARFRMPEHSDSVSIEAVAVSDFGAQSQVSVRRWKLSVDSATVIEWLFPGDSARVLQNSFFRIGAHVESPFLSILSASLIDSSGLVVSTLNNLRDPNIFEGTLDTRFIGSKIFRIAVSNDLGETIESTPIHIFVELDSKSPDIHWVYPSIDTVESVLGAHHKIQILAKDDAGIRSVDFRVGGILLPPVISSPYDAIVGGWLGIGVHELQAVAIDVNGNHSEPVLRYLRVVPDQGGTLYGVLKNPGGEVLASAEVYIGRNIRVATDAYGYFEAKNVPSQQGPMAIQLEVNWGGQSWVGYSPLHTITTGTRTQVGPIMWTTVGTLYGWGRGRCYSGLEGRSCSYPEGDSILQNHTIRPSRIHQAPSRFASVQMSDQSVLALDTTGTLWGWGSNYTGYLGVGKDDLFYRPYPVHGPGPVVQFARGHSSTLVVDSAGQVWSFGRTWDSSSGDWEATTYVPVSQPLPKIRQVAVGDELELAVAQDGKVFVRGYNRNGEFGNGTTATPDGSGSDRHWNIVPGLSNVERIRSAWSTVSALDNLGRLWRWGLNAISESRTCSYSSWNAELGEYQEVEEICHGIWSDSTPRIISLPGNTLIKDFGEGGGNAFWALDILGRLWAYAASNCPRFGMNDCSEYPNRLWTELPTSLPVDSILVTRSQGMVIYRLRDGSWWSATYRDGMQTNLNVPLFSRSVSIDESSYGRTVLVVDSSGNILGRGNNSNLGIFWPGSDAADTIRTLNRIFSIPSLPVSRSVNDGVVWVENEKNVMGLGVGAGADRRGWSDSPGKLIARNGISQIHQGYSGIHILDSVGARWYWGGLPYSGLGVGSAANSLAFDTLGPVPGARLYKLIGSDAFGQISFGLVAPDSMEIWSQSLGSTPLGIRLPGRLKSWSSNGISNIVMLFESGKVGLLGSCGQGECGRPNYPAPFTYDTRDSLGEPGVEILDLPPAQDAKTVYGGTLVVLRDGTVWSSGYTGMGTLGIGERSDYVTRFQKVPGLEGIDHLEASYYSVIAVGRDGRAWSWGSNTNYDYFKQIDWTPKLLPVSNVGEASLSGSERFFVRTGLLKGTP